jgi:hypothetical protein
MPAVFSGEARSMHAINALQGCRLQMDGRLRVSLLTLFSRDITYSDIRPLMQAHLGLDFEREYRQRYSASESAAGPTRLQVKSSRVIAADDLDEAGLLRFANAFRDAGYGDVAWKVTPIAPGETDPENTTASFPAELFQACLDADTPQDDPLSDIPPEPFGSDAFWKWFDEGDG